MSRLFLLCCFLAAFSCSGCAHDRVTPAQSSSTSAGQSTHSSGIYRVRMFFGLSLPSGGGVSLRQWQQFQNEYIAKAFAGFNVVDSTGYYQGEPERSKVVTIVVCEQEMSKVRAVAAEYARQFHQDSVMLVQVPVSSWEFVSADGQVQKQQC